MALTILLTGFGPFPGEPSNPTGPLVEQLAVLRRPELSDMQIVPHVFATSYRAVDRDLPRLLADLKPDALLMFGLASRSSSMRVEMRARNALAALPDAEGRLPSSGIIVPDGPAALLFGVPALKLAFSACKAGAAARPSRNAGDYLCNYLSWCALKAAARPGGPTFTAFIHVPPLGARSIILRRWDMPRLLRGGQAILLAAAAETRKRRHMTER
jgi:pyroglutamyl-peptidase